MVRIELNGPGLFPRFFIEIMIISSKDIHAVNCYRAKSDFELISFNRRGSCWCHKNEGTTIEVQIVDDNEQTGFDQD
jgi:hypothetical protein